MASLLFVPSLSHLMLYLRAVLEPETHFLLSFSDTSVFLLFVPHAIYTFLEISRLVPIADSFHRKSSPFQFIVALFPHVY